MRLEKGIDILRSRCNGAKSALISSYIINPLALKGALGRGFPYDALILYSGEKTIEIDRSIKTKKFIDSSSIPLHGYSFHSKLYLFEKRKGNESELDLIVASFNATSAGLNQNFEFWVEAKAKLDLSYFGKKHLVELVLDPHIDVDAVVWKEFCFEESRQLVVMPALEVLWRLAKNGVGLAPGKPRCIPDMAIIENRYKNYDSILVHTLGNNSLYKAIDIMIREAVENSDNITIRVMSPYHNIQGLKHLYQKCLHIIGKKDVFINIEVLTVFPPDFPEKFGDPRKHPFTRLEDIEGLSSKDQRIKFSLRLWKKDVELSVTRLDSSLDEYRVMNVFLHAKAILVKSGERCQCLIGSPNATDKAIGKGPGLNFETAVWERGNHRATSLWEKLDSLFVICPKAGSEDYRICNAWNEFFDSAQYNLKANVIGSREAIGRYMEFLVKKGDDVFQLSVHNELPVYYDEMDCTKLLVVMKSDAPKISPKAYVYFIPSEVEKTIKTEVKFKNGQLLTTLFIDSTIPDTVSIRVDIESKLIEEYTVKIKDKAKVVEVVSRNVLVWDPSNEEAGLVVETETGRVEIPCRIVGSSLRAEKSSLKITSKNALLRIYSKSITNYNSFGYFRIRYRKRPPQFKTKLACITPFPFSVYFEELENPLCARIIPHTVSISLLTKDNDEIATIPIGTRLLSEYPYIQSHLMRFRQCPQNLNEMKVEVRFEDEHNGYYDFLSPAKRLGYSEIDEQKTTIFIPEEMGETIVFASSLITKKLLPKLLPAGIRCYKIPTISFFCDRDERRIFILQDFLSEFLTLLENQVIHCFPDPACIVDSAPITLELSSIEIPERIQNLCKKVILRWYVRHWSKAMGPEKRQPFTLPIRFNFLPSEIEKVRRDFDIKKAPFEGYLDIELHYEMERGYDLLCKKSTFKIIKTQEFVRRIGEEILEYLEDKKQLICELVHLYHSIVAKEIPIEIFKDAVKGCEIALFTLREQYKCSPLISRGFPIFSFRQDNHDQLVRRTSKLILENISKTFSVSPRLPKIPQDLLNKLLSDIIDRFIKSFLIDHGFKDSIRITPACFFAKIDPKWETYF